MGIGKHILMMIKGNKIKYENSDGDGKKYTYDMNNIEFINEFNESNLC